MHKAKRRDREEIIFEILKAAKTPTTKTRLIYASFLSGTELNEYVKMLIDRKMLELDELSRKLMTTDEGRRFMRVYEDMRDVRLTMITNS